MKAWLLKHWYRHEYAWHKTDAYLARNRGDTVFASDCDSRADECLRQLARLDIQRRYA